VVDVVANYGGNLRTKDTNSERSHVGWSCSPRERRQPKKRSSRASLIVHTWGSPKTSATTASWALISREWPRNATWRANTAKAPSARMVSSGASSCRLGVSWPYNQASRIPLPSTDPASLVEADLPSLDALQPSTDVVETRVDHRILEEANHLHRLREVCRFLLEKIEAKCRGRGTRRHLREKNLQAQTRPDIVTKNSV